MVLADIWLVLNNKLDNLSWTFAQNIVLIVGVFALAIFYLLRLRNAKTPAVRWLMIGIILNALGYGIHRTWFSIMRYAEQCCPGAVPTFFLENSYILFFAIIMIVVGTGYHMREWFVQKCGRRWLWVYGAIALAVFNIGLYVGTVN